MIELADPLAIPTGRIARGIIRPPGSKSITNRALVLAVLAGRDCRLIGPLSSEDTHVMVEAWRAVGVKIDTSDPGCWMVQPQRFVPDGDQELYVANSGTTVRFLTAALATLQQGSFRVYGVERMHQRPIGPLVTALRQLGAAIEYEQAEGYPPLVIRPRGLRGGTVTISGSESSQFVSGLLMAATRADGPVEIELTGPVVSAPFVELTVRMLSQFGAEVEASWYVPLAESERVPPGRAVARFRVRPGLAGVAEYEIEPDATAASYFWAAAALTGGDVLVDGLARDRSLQGDVAFVDVLRDMGATVRQEGSGIRVQGGALHAVDVNLSAISDTTPTFAVLAAFAEGVSRIRGVRHIRLQETDRISAIASELRRIGGKVQEHDDGLTIYGPCPLRGATIQTYRDHRIAMAFALAGLRVPNIRIANPGCTAKTYPSYWTDLFALLQPA